MYLSESFLDSSTPDNLVDIQGYNLVRADHQEIPKEAEFTFIIKSLSLFEL